MSQTKPKLKTKAALKTMTRTALLTSTAQKMMECFKQYDASNGQWVLDRLDTIIKHELITGIELAAYDGKEPITSVSFTINWADHKVLQSVNDEVDVTGLEDGETFISTLQIIEVVRNYLDQLKTAYPDLEFQTWIARNPAAEQALGQDRYHELLGIPNDPVAQAEGQEQYRRLSLMHLARKARDIVIPKIEETSVSIK